MSLKLIPYYKIEISDLVDMVVDEQSDINTDIPKTFILDEMHTAFDGRRSSSGQNEILRQFVSQCRKRKIDMYYSDQYISGADVSLRSITSKLVRCMPIVSINDVGLGDISTPEPLKFRYYIWDIDQNKTIVKKWSRNVARLFYNFYDTYEVIRPRADYIGV